VMRAFLAVTMALGVLAVAARLTAQQPPEVKAGPEHEKLKESVGTWDATVKSMGGESKGTQTCKLGLNGLWLLEHFKADLGGMTFEGHGATSYDPAKKKYVNVWIDSMSTRPMISEGTYDKSTKTMTLVGDMPMPDGKSMKTTLVTVHKDADTQVFRLLGAGPDGKEFEMIHITYKRRAK
jgi:Protein of unknown function (DUF1579)